MLCALNADSGESCLQSPEAGTCLLAAAEFHMVAHAPHTCVCEMPGMPGGLPQPPPHPARPRFNALAASWPWSCTGSPGLLLSRVPDDSAALSPGAAEAAVQAVVSGISTGHGHR